MALTTRRSDSEAELTTSADFIIVSRLWALICFLFSVVLLISGLVGVVLIHCLRGPEMLGHVSSSV